MQICTDTQSALILIEGPDTQKFLQGQTTCDFRQATSEAAIAGAHCNAKGRMIADFIAVATGADQMTIRTEQSAAPLLTASLGKYIVFSKAKLQPSEDRITGLCGEGTLLQLAGRLNIHLNQDRQSVSHELGRFTRLTAELVEVWQSPAQQQQLVEALVAASGTANDWRLAHIRAGLGCVTAATSLEWIPQMLNYQLAAVNGISFTKGCYTGQEIVARMQYRGKLKRHMYRLASDGPLEPGCPLYRMGSEQSVGEVVSCAASASGYELLAVITSSALEPDATVFANSSGNNPVHCLSLPYELPETAAVE